MNKFKQVDTSEQRCQPLLRDSLNKSERNLARQKLQQNLQLSFEPAQSWSKQSYKVVPHLSQLFLKQCIAANSCNNIVQIGNNIFIKKPINYWIPQEFA